MIIGCHQVYNMGIRMKIRFLITPFLIIAAMMLTGCGDTTLKSILAPSLSKAAPTSQPATEGQFKRTPAPTTGEQIPSPSPTSPPTKKGAVETDCTDQDPHPVGKSIAEKFDVTYEEVMTWYCRGETFEDILLALQTSKMSDKTPGELLKMKETQSWDDIWDDLGITSPEQ